MIGTINPYEQICDELKILSQLIYITAPEIYIMTLWKSRDSNTALNFIKCYGLPGFHMLTSIMNCNNCDNWSQLTQLSHGYLRFLKFSIEQIVRTQIKGLDWLLERALWLDIQYHVMLVPLSDWFIVSGCKSSGL